MRLGLITDEVSQDLQEALDLAEEFNIRDLELRSVWGKNVVHLDADEVADVGKLIRRRGMRVVSVAGPVYKCHLRGGTRERVGNLHGGPEELPPEAHLELLRKCLELADAWDAQFVRTFSFWRTTPVPGPDLYREIASALQRLLAIVRGSGRRLLLENEHACYIGTGAEVEELWRYPGLEELGLIWDPGNAFFLGETPYPDGYEAVKRGPGMERVLHVHVKDARATGKPAEPYEWTEVGKGEIDYVGQFAALARDGYVGVLSLETHWRPAEISGREASRRCLTGMIQALQRAGLRQTADGEWVEGAG
ncbi:MAG: sugar phosphate isomerase/epimerase [Limnochordales bacterium]|nr:sugar phosphate isomerase/epimerase [Limnochordales bacterium]